MVGHTTLPRDAPASGACGDEGVGWGGGGGAKSELWVRIEKGKELAVVGGCSGSEGETGVIVKGKGEQWGEREGR